MKLCELYVYVKQKLSQNYSNDSNDSICSNLQQECMVILGHVMNLSSIDIISRFNEDIVDQDLQYKVQNLVTKRLSGMPIEYITEKAQFMSLEFCVNQNVLIPRPETELLVELAIERSTNYSNYSNDIQILDLCTGSGCIALSLAKYIKNSKVIGVDISTKALKVAKKNKKNLCINNCNFFKFDCLRDLSGLIKYSDKKYDILTCNPPYINEIDMLKLSESVSKFEPHIALRSDKDGLKFYKSIIRHLFKIMNKNGLVIFEIGYNQANSVKKLIECCDNNFKNVEIHKDLFGNNRICTAFYSV